MAQVKISHAQWLDAAKERYGANSSQWRFRCPCCGVSTAVHEWSDAGAKEGAVAFSCIGRYLPGETRSALAADGNGPCNYTGGGLLQFNPVFVTDDEGVEHRVFDFADRPLCAKSEAA